MAGRHRTIPIRRAPRSAVAVLAAVAMVVSTLAVLVATPTAAQAASRSATVTSAVGYAHARHYSVAVSVLDTKTGHLYSAGAHTSKFASESVVKVFIAARLIVQGRMHGQTAKRAYKMITQSDDGIATSFYGSVGGDSLIDWVKKYFHVRSLGSRPHRAGWWGNTHITSDGLVRLYAKIKANKRVGHWIMNAMRHAHKYGSDGTYQYFGLRSANKYAAIKQGWGTDFDDWGHSADFNSTGYVNGYRYAVAILVRGPVSSYGGRIDSILTGVARRLLPKGVFPAANPRIAWLTAHSGTTSGGSQVVIHGYDLTHVITVWVGGHRAGSVRSLSPWRVAVRTPSHVAGRVVVRVETTHGTSSTHGAYFTYVHPPTVASRSATGGPVAGGTSVTLTGRDFTHVRKVVFGSTPGTRLTVTSARTLRVTAPAHAAGTVHIRVTTAYGTSPAVASDEFAYR